MLTHYVVEADRRWVDPDIGRPGTLQLAQVLDVHSLFFVANGTGDAFAVLPHQRPSPFVPTGGVDAAVLEALEGYLELQDVSSYFSPVNQTHAFLTMVFGRPAHLFSAEDAAWFYCHAVRRAADAQPPI